jgi:ComF family protein
MRAAMLAAIYRGLLDLVAPPTCGGCDLPADDPHRFCPACSPLLERTEHGMQALGAYAYGGPLADAIRRYKYGGRPDLAPALVSALVPALAELAGTYDVISFVPLHPRRLRARGFDQAGLLAHGAGRRLGVPVRTLLERTRVTEVQASLDRRARATNVRSAFRASATDASVLLLDDVRTTGATLAEAARALTDAGARVRPFALAIADEGEDG